MNFCRWGRGPFPVKNDSKKILSDFDCERTFIHSGGWLPDQRVGSTEQHSSGDICQYIYISMGGGDPLSAHLAEPAGP